MSFIRSSSNSEGIYIIETCSGIEIMVYTDSYKMPTSIFYKLMKMYILDPTEEKYSYRAAKLRFDDEDCKWHLSYKDWTILFSDSVLSHIMLHNPTKFCTKKEFISYCGL